MISKTLFAITLVAIVLNLCLAQEKKTCRVRQLESRLKSLMGSFGYKDYVWPQSDEEMQKLCRSIQRDSAASKRFVNKCYDGLASTLMSVSIYGAERLSRLFCNNKVERNEYISRGKCGNSGMNGTTQCWQRLIDIMSNVKYLNESSEKIPVFCCAFFVWRDCTLDVYKNIDTNICSASDVEGFDRQISRGSIDPLNLMCGSYDEVEKCGKMNEKFNTTKDGRKYRTMFPAIIEVFDSL